MKGKFDFFEPLLKKMAKFLRERETGGTNFVSSPMASHNMTLIEV